MKLSIVFPAYNEAERILPVLESYYLFLRNKLGGDFEVVVVPNNCSDDTVEVVRGFSFGKKNVRFFEIVGYSGKGGAVMKGFDLAKGNLVGFVDADKSTSPEEFFKLYDNIGKSDGVIGSRKMKGAQIIPKRRFGKNVSSWGFGFMVRLLFGLGYKDTQCGAKIFRKKVSKYLIKNVTEKGWIFDVDVLNLCKKRGYKIKEFPILWRDDDGSHVGIWEGIKSIFLMICYRISSF